MNQQRQMPLIGGSRAVRPNSFCLYRFRFVLFLFVFVLHIPLWCRAEDPAVPEAPKLLSVFPWGGQRGSIVQASVRGEEIAGAYAVWFDKGNFQTRILRLEEVAPDKEPSAMETAKRKPPAHTYRALIEVRIDPNTPPGVYGLRLVTPHGLTSPIQFPVVADRVVVEKPGVHETSAQAQAISIPAILTGRMANPGELDYYTIHATKGQEISFEVVLAQNCVPRMALYSAGGSWFDSDRLTRLLFQEELSSDLMQRRAWGTFRAPRDGEYFLEVSSLYGKGTSDSTYAVRISSGPLKFPAVSTLDNFVATRAERDFSRVLDGNWIRSLKARELLPGPQAKSDITTGQAGQESKPAAALKGAATTVGDAWFNQPLQQLNAQAAADRELPVPVLVEGTINHPGDIASFKFKAEDGQEVAFEIEAPDAKPPFFNPRLGVLDSHDHELFSNVERVLSMFNANGDPQVYLKRVVSRTTYTFQHGGEYVLQIRDITQRYGGPNYRYKVLIRPEVPHVGEVKIMNGDPINLSPSQSQRVSLVAAFEEGFSGGVSYTFTGLPEGVQVLPGSQFSNRPAPNEKTENPDVVAPKQQEATVFFVASPTARSTLRPALVQLHYQPIVNGKLGPRVFVRELPLMVIAPPGTERK